MKTCKKALFPHATFIRTMYKNVRWCIVFLQTCMWHTVIHQAGFMWLIQTNLEAYVSQKAYISYLFLVVAQLSDDVWSVCVSNPDIHDDALIHKSDMKSEFLLKRKMIVYILTSSWAVTMTGHLPLKLESP